MAVIEQELEAYNQAEQKKENKYVKTYSKLFRVDRETHHEKFFVETPFTFIHWRMIEMLHNMC